MAVSIAAATAGRKHGPVRHGEQIPVRRCELFDKSLNRFGQTAKCRYAGHRNIVYLEEYNGHHAVIARTVAQGPGWECETSLQGSLSECAMAPTSRRRVDFCRRSLSVEWRYESPPLVRWFRVRNFKTPLVVEGQDVD